VLFGLKKIRIAIGNGATIRYSLPPSSSFVRTFILGFFVLSFSFLRSDGLLKGKREMRLTYPSRSKRFVVAMTPDSLEVRTGQGYHKPHNSTEAR